MVLELTDKRESTGKSWWVPVTQKTYWPPPAPTSCSTPGSTTARQESSTSYSVSDDSSVQSQSSPWQRESRWKNPNPRRLPGESGQDFSFHDRRSGRDRRCRWNLRRRPFRLPPVDLCNGNEMCSQCASDTTKWRRNGGKRPPVASVVSKLMDKALTRKLLATTAESSLSSPRKRLLKDMEKVRLHDPSTSPGLSNRPSWNALKKAKAVVPPAPLPTHHSAAVVALAAAAAAASAHSLQPAKVYDRQSSYSIDSLLNKQERQQAEASNSSFLRSLLRKAPPTSPSSSVNGLTHSSTVAAASSVASASAPTTKVRKSVSPAVYSHPRLPLSPPELVPMSALHAAVVLGARPPLWLPYNVGALPNPFVPPSATVPIANPLATPPGLRPGPSRSPNVSARLHPPAHHQPSPPSPDNDDNDADEAPLNLSTTPRSRES